MEDMADIGHLAAKRHLAAFWLFAPKYGLWPEIALGLSYFTAQQLAAFWPFAAQRGRIPEHTLGHGPFMPMRREAAFWPHSH